MVYFGDCAAPRRRAEGTDLPRTSSVAFAECHIPLRLVLASAQLQAEPAVLHKLLRLRRLERTNKPDGH